MTTLASQVLLWALVSIPAYLVWRSISHSHACQPTYHETADEAEWAEAYVTWRIDQIHEHDQEGQQ